MPLGPAAAAATDGGRTISRGDKLLAINDAFVAGLTHDEVVARISAPGDTLTLRLQAGPGALPVSHSTGPTPIEGRLVHLSRAPGAGLGIRIKTDDGTLGGTVLEVIDGSPAAESRQVFAGDRFVRVNGKDVTGISHHELVTILGGKRWCHAVAAGV